MISHIIFHDAVVGGICQDRSMFPLFYVTLYTTGQTCSGGSSIGEGNVDSLDDNIDTSNGRY